MDIQDIKYSGILLRYLAEETDQAENSAVEEWLGSDEKNRLFFEDIRDVWGKTGTGYQFEGVDVDAIWEDTKQKILRKHIQQPAKRSLIKNIYRISISIAAVLIIALGLWFIFSEKPEMITASTTQERNFMVDLPDKSKISLNSNTAIQYPEEFSDKLREVSMLKGKAFFEVNDKAGIPFIVNAYSAKIQSLGTSFVVCIDSLAGQVKVTVETGSVLLYGKDENIINLSDKNILRPNEKGVFCEKGGCVSKGDNTELNYMTWKTGIIIFEETEMSEVAEFLMQEYDVIIEIQDEEFGKCKLSAQFDNKPIDFILDILEVTFGIEVEKKNGRIILIGSGC